MFDLLALLRAVAFAAFYGGIEYRYIYRREAPWTKEVEGFEEKPAFWLIFPYHIFFLFPIFVAVSFSPAISAWAGNAFMVAFLEDVAYFTWRGVWVRRGEWTTRLFGVFSLAGRAIPAWWPMAVAVALAFYLMPL